MKTALITGISGQDGYYMAELLRSKGYEVHGTKGAIDNHGAIYSHIKIIRPDEIYNFAGHSNVFNPWEDINNVFNVNGKIPQYFLQSILDIDKSIKYFQASSCLIFGKNEDGVQNELTPTSPIHPYGIAKLYADNMVEEFRRVYGLFACSGILFNHESPRRGNDFFSKRICKAAANGETIKVGNLDSFRDYGYAPDYMEAACLMMQNEEPMNYVIGTGKLTSMNDFAMKAFEYVGLNYENHLIIDEVLHRTNDTNILMADTDKIFKDLGWFAKTSVDQLIKIMIDHERTF